MRLYNRFEFPASYRMPTIRPRVTGPDILFTLILDTTNNLLDFCVTKRLSDLLRWSLFVDALQIINELNRTSGGEGESSSLNQLSVFEDWPNKLDDPDFGLMQGFEIHEMLRRRKNIDACFEVEECSR